MQLNIEENEYTCRICFEPGVRTDFIAPCACAGTSKWVHRGCLDKWRSVREDTAFAKCTECLTPYELIPRHPDTPSARCQSQTYYYYLVSRDLLAVLLVQQILIVMLGSIIFGYDQLIGHSAIITAFKMVSKSKEFYYLSGWVFFFSIMGLFYFCGQRFGLESTPSNSIQSCCCCCCDSRYNGAGGGVDPMYWWLWNDNITMGHPGFYCYSCDCCTCPCVDCCSSSPSVPTAAAGSTGSHDCGALCCTSCGDACGANFGCCECGSVGGGASCCGESCCASCGEEAMYLLIVVFVVVVVVGAVVSIAVGALYFSFIVQRHVKVLKKWSLAQEFVVLDKAANDDIDLRNPLVSVSSNKHHHHDAMASSTIPASTTASQLLEQGEDEFSHLLSSTAAATTTATKQSLISSLLSEKCILPSEKRIYGDNHLDIELGAYRDSNTSTSSDCINIGSHELVDEDANKSSVDVIPPMERRYRPPSLPPIKSSTEQSQSHRRTTLTQTEMTRTTPSHSQSWVAYEQQQLLREKQKHTQKVKKGGIGMVMIRDAAILDNADMATMSATQQQQQQQPSGNVIPSVFSASPMLSTSQRDYLHRSGLL